MTQCLAAHTGATPPTGYVGFINAYELDDGTVQVTLREEAQIPAVGMIRMTRAEWAEFIGEAVVSGSPGMVVSIYESISRRATEAARAFGLIR